MFIATVYFLVQPKQNVWDARITHQLHIQVAGKDDLTETGPWRPFSQYRPDFSMEGRSDGDTVEAALTAAKTVVENLEQRFGRSFVKVTSHCGSCSEYSNLV